MDQGRFSPFLSLSKQGAMVQALVDRLGEICADIVYSGWAQFICERNFHKICQGDLPFYNGLSGQMALFILSPLGLKCPAAMEVALLQILVKRKSIWA